MRRYYQILGISPNATPEEIKAAWLFSIKAFHPDKFSSSSPQHQRTADTRTKAINEAYAVLSDPHKRSAYDSEFADQDRNDAPRPKPTAPPPAPSPPPPPPPSPPPPASTSAPETPRTDLAKGPTAVRLVVVGIFLTIITAALITTNFRSTKPRPVLSLAPARSIATTEKALNAESALERETLAENKKKPGESDASVANTFDLPRLAKEARKAVVFIVGFDARGKVVQTGSGFFISTDGRIATNRHVIAGLVSATAKSEDGTIYKIDGVLAVSASLDLAVLKVETRQTPFLALEISTLPEAGSRVAVIGSPVALEGTLSEGIVSAIRAEAEGTWIQITAPLSPGSSGSPVLNGNGRVIGVATLNSSGRIQNLSFARSAHDLAALIGKIQKGAKPGPLSNLFLQDRAALPAASPSPSPQITYRVTGLPKRTPFLNVRAGPGANYAVIAIFTPTGRGIILGPGRVRNGETIWQEIFSGSYHGWVSAEYLVAETPKP